MFKKISNLQLFDERKLELINDIWTMEIEHCVGNKFLKELNPTMTSSRH